MKTFKIFSILLLLVVASFAFSPDVYGKVKNKKNPPVGAPIDGGLLTILGAAGVTYYLARKKKNNSSEI